MASIITVTVGHKTREYLPNGNEWVANVYYRTLPQSVIYLSDIRGGELYDRAMDTYLEIENEGNGYVALACKL